MEVLSETRFINRKTKTAFYNLKKGTHEEKELFNDINFALNALENNAVSGIQIPKKLIPKEYIKKYHIDNLWKINLPKGFRLIYTIVNSEVVVISILVDWFNHKEYERKFKY